MQKCGKSLSCSFILMWKSLLILVLFVCSAVRAGSSESSSSEGKDDKPDRSRGRSRPAWNQVRAFTESFSYP